MMRQVERYETVEQYLEHLSEETGIEIERLRIEYNQQ
jgi:hypothetical protein